MVYGSEYRRECFRELIEKIHYVHENIPSDKLVFDVCRDDEIDKVLKLEKSEKVDSYQYVKKFTWYISTCDDPIIITKFYEETVGEPGRKEHNVHLFFGWKSTLFRITSGNSFDNTRGGYKLWNMGKFGE